MSFFRGKVPEKSFGSLLHGVPGHNGPWGPSGAHMGHKKWNCVKIHFRLKIFDFWGLGAVYEKKYQSLKNMRVSKYCNIDLEKKSGIFQKKVGSFHQSVLEKRSRLEIGSSHTAAKRSITYEASKKLKIMFFLEIDWKKMGPELWKKIWESKKMKFQQKLVQNKDFWVLKTCLGSVFDFKSI